MGTVDFQVDPDALLRSARSMVALSADLAQVRATIRGIDGSDFGHPTACQATNDFVRHWEFQAGRLGDAVQSVGDRLQATAVTYREAESQLVRRFGATGGDT